VFWLFCHGLFQGGYRAQAQCFDSKIMAQSSVFTENNFKFSGQKNMRTRYRSGKLTLIVSNLRATACPAALCANAGHGELKSAVQRRRRI
jgi:hypothetical protein